MASNGEILSSLLSDQAMVSPAIVSLLHAWQLTGMAKHVGSLRQKYKISPPVTSGRDPAFDRGFRAQQNTLEFTPIFLILLWVAAKFLNPVLASVAGLLYIKGRWYYFDGYCAQAEKRLPGFYLAVRAIMVLFGLSVAGIIHTTLSVYFNINVIKIVGLENYIP
ncbi:microsomal glutathione S-transferase 2-like [Asterias amurensis]|uniref:microsomal glutathione S-transferase 2-like n=1 Tax=Asterias amurensis TaxID=7602 RepID=UPI003AB6E4EA